MYKVKMGNITVVQDVPLFNQYDKVMVNGDHYKGEGWVELSYYPTEAPKRELAYSLDYEQLFPQILIRGKDIPKGVHMNGEDLFVGKVTPIKAADKDAYDAWMESKTIADEAQAEADHEIHLQEMLSGNFSREEFPIIYNGGYGREGHIWSAISRCDGCGQKKPVICVDSSEGEYSTGKICQECITKILVKE